MEILDWMGQHPGLTVFLAIIILGGIEEITSSICRKQNNKRKDEDDL